MLEICPSIAEGKPSLRNSSARHRRQGRSGAACVRHAARRGAQRVARSTWATVFVCSSTKWTSSPPEQAVAEIARGARGVDMPSRTSTVAAAAWIYAGGAHHTGFSQAVTTEMLEDFAAMAGIEIVVIDAGTKLRQFKQELSGTTATFAAFIVTSEKWRQCSVDALLGNAKKCSLLM